MSCFIPHRRQKWTKWPRGSSGSCVCDFFGDGSCIGFWPFNDSVEDTCGNLSVELSGSGQPNFVEGFAGNSVELSTSSDKFFRLITNDFPNISSLSITFWARATFTTSYIRITSIVAYGSGGMLQIHLYPDAFSGTFWYYMTTRLYLSVSLDTISEWQFFCTIREPTKFTLYVFDEDGGLVGSDEQVPGLHGDIVSDNEQEIICNYGAYDGSVFIDNYRVFNRALTFDECVALCLEDRCS